MKKILLALVAISLSTMLRAQDIVANGVPIGNNTVMYATSDIKIFNGKEKNSGVYSEVGLSLACEYNIKTKIKKWVVSLSLITDGKLKSKDFCKIRIVTLIKKLDYNLKGDEVKSALSKCYNVIQKEISNKTAGIYEGF